MNKYTSFISKRVLETQYHPEFDELDEIVINGSIRMEEQISRLLNKMKKGNSEKSTISELDKRLAETISWMQIRLDYFRRFEIDTKNTELIFAHDNILRFFDWIVWDIGNEFIKLGLKKAGFLYSWFSHFALFEDNEFDEKVSMLYAKKAKFNMELEQGKTPTVNKFVYKGINDSKQIEFDLVKSGDFEVALYLLEIDARHKAIYSVFDKNSKDNTMDKRPATINSILRMQLNMFWTLTHWDLYRFQIDRNSGVSGEIIVAKEPSDETIKIIEVYGKEWAQKFQIDFPGAAFWYK